LEGLGLLKVASDLSWGFELKLRPDVLVNLVFGRVGVRDPSVVVGPAIGEDSAIIDLGGFYLVVHSDPITGAVASVDWLSVHVADNDVAVRGARPRWFLPVILLPEGSSLDLVDSITSQIDTALRELEAMVIGGHSEYTPGLDRPIISMTALGLVEKDKLVLTSGARLGDYVVMTKSAAVEGTSILAIDFEEELSGRGVPRWVLEKAKRYSKMISVVREALELAEERYATSMHDPTEGGLIGGLTEVAYASKKTIEVWENLIPIAEETRIICRALKVDPLKLISSGVLIATIPEGRVEEALGRLKGVGVEATVMGRVKEYNGSLLELHRLDGSVERFEKVHVGDELMRIVSERYRLM
jgi:hydrogenase maturation factor